MFARRLKVFLIILISITLVLVARAVQVQIFQRSHWRDEAARSMRRSILVETTRGAILDVKGREIAVDVACIDACVDYRVLGAEPDPIWVREFALRRLRTRLGTGYAKTPSSERVKLLAAEMQRVRDDIEAMWTQLASLSGKSVEDIYQIREAIRQKVELRRRYVWYWRYQQAKQDHQATREELDAQASWFQQWILDLTQSAPELDDFDVTVGEQLDYHPILNAIDNDTANLLGKNIDQYPGLFLRQSKHRFYPYGDTGAHVIGNLTKVNKEDLQVDPNAKDDLKRYYPNDLIGRSGLEKLAETTLRGARGRNNRVIGEDEILDKEPPVAGQHVRATIDIELQSDIQRVFASAEEKVEGGGIYRHPMHGAAVVIDVKSGEVRALVSYPTYDLNEYDRRYTLLADDLVNSPLLNRATQWAVAPGSTVKPLVGLGAMAKGIISPTDTIECTGFLVINGRKYSMGRCWTESMFHTTHKAIPSAEPHSTGFLTYSDAIERSCNIYFETLAHRLNMSGVAWTFDKFGLGRKTGIGIPEAKGILPNPLHIPPDQRMAATWFAGIGQGHITATPIQMANAAATIARDGVWMRPHLLPVSKPAAGDVVDLQLPREALAAAKRGMFGVVNHRAGTGTHILHDEKVTSGVNKESSLYELVAAKTGTAQAPKFSIPMRDANGKLLRDSKGRIRRELLQVSTPANPNPIAPWYTGSGEDHDELDHAWYIGFTPYENPQIAFAVMVEYGGSGGKTAAGIARHVLEACQQHGYLSIDATQRSAASAE